MAEEKIGTNGESRKIVYDKDGKAIGYVDENGKVVKFSKDDKPKVIGKVGASRRLAYDKDGNVIVTRLNEQMCQEIAKAGGGIYVRVDNTNNAEKALNAEINKLAKADVETQVYTEFDEQLQVQAW